MKKLFSLLLCVSFMVSCLVFNVDAKTSTYVEYLEDGSYIVTEIYEVSSLARANKSGYKTNTFFNSSGKKVYGVTVNGEFTYVNGVSVNATSSTATVNIYTSDAKYVSRNAYCSGASAYATSTFTYNGTNRTLTAKLTCDKYGNLS